MLSAIGRIFSGRESGTPFTQSVSSARVIWHALSREIPLSNGARASSESLVPLQHGQVLIFKNLSTLFIPFSSLTFDNAFSTV